MMLQNMQSVYSQALKTHGKKSEFYRTAAVAYMMINMTISNSMAEKNQLLLPSNNEETSKVQQWFNDQTRAGKADETLLASVEIVGAGRVSNNLN
jgi:hypothetical protein